MSRELFPAAPSVKVPNGLFHYVGGGLQNQIDHLRDTDRFDQERFVVPPSEETLLKLRRFVRGTLTPSAFDVPVVDAAHAIKGLERQADSLLKSAEENRNNLYGEAARQNARTLDFVARFLDDKLGEIGAGWFDAEPEVFFKDAEAS